MLLIAGSHGKALRILSAMKAEGIRGELVSTPREYAKEGCSYSIDFRLSDKAKVQSICKKAGIYANFV